VTGRRAGTASPGRGPRSTCARAPVSSFSPRRTAPRLTQMPN